jgi:histidinol-phosphatase
VSDDLALALALADEADAIALGSFRSRDLVVTTKPDQTPVTEADSAVEAAIRGRLDQERPEDGFVGEESGSLERNGGRRWIVDPIDGTRNYLRGIPVWATLIALEADGDVAVGVVSAPALHRRWCARRGGGAWASGEPIHVSGVRRLEEAVVSFTRSAEDLPGMRELSRRSWHARGFGDFWGHMLVAEGAADANVDAPGVTVWDLAAVQIVVEEAGGRFTDLGGARRLDGGSALSTNGHLHDAVLATLGVGT